MNVKFLNPFIEAAIEVLKVETQASLTRGDLSLDKTVYHTDDVTVIISLVGAVAGTVFYSMDVNTALSLASKIMGEKMETFDNLAQSGCAELGNVITGRASVKLASAGYEAIISPPTLLIGKGATINTLELPRLIVPLMIEGGGEITIHIALREGTIKNVPTPDIPQPNRPML